MEPTGKKRERKGWKLSRNFISSLFPGPGAGPLGEQRYFPPSHCMVKSEHKKGQQQNGKKEKGSSRETPLLSSPFWVCKAKQSLHLGPSARASLPPIRHHGSEEEPKSDEWVACILRKMWRRRGGKNTSSRCEICQIFILASWHALL